MDEQPYMDPTLLESFDEIYYGEMEEVSDLSNPSNSLESNFHGSQVEISEHDTMLSLTEKNFQSREDLLGIVREIALKQGYATVIRRSKADKYVIIGCERGGNYRNTNLSLEDKKRKTASRLINCPFEIWGKKKQEGFWKVDIKNLSHNHDPEQVMHFGNRVSSRAKGAHAMLKKYLQVSTGGLREVQEKICLAIENQFQEIKVRLSSEKIRVSHRLRIPFFKELVTHVSMFALDELHKQYGLAKSTDILSRCKGHFFKTMGLPCAHMIREMRSELQLKDVHEQWRIDTRSFSDVCDFNLDGDRDEISDLLADFKSKYEKMPISEKEGTKRQISQFLCASLPLILEPTIQARKGRPSKSKKRKESNSTQREPSSFEIVENSRKCSICNSVGHNRRTCELNERAT